MREKRCFYVSIARFEGRPVVPGGAGGARVPGCRGAMTPPDFGRLVNPISTKGGRSCPPNNTGTPGFSDLPKALHPTLYILTDFHGDVRLADVRSILC